MKNVLLPIVIPTETTNYFLQKALNVSINQIQNDIRRNNLKEFKILNLFTIISDLPARSKILNMKSNGHLFCNICFNQGELIFFNNYNNSKVVFPVSENDYELRTKSSYFNTFHILKNEEFSCFDGFFDVPKFIDTHENFIPPSINVVYDIMHSAFSGFFKRDLTLFTKNQ